MTIAWTVVLDVGKTLAKATLWNEARECVAERIRPNERASAGKMCTLDAVGIEQWLERTLKEFAVLGPVRTIIPVAHGAAAALLHEEHLLAAPIDYEWAGVARDRAPYDTQRDCFEASGSPALPAGLNLGLQLHWLESLPSNEYRCAQILPWPQYWAWVLSGVAASEVTSLGCHTDLWRPYSREPSELAIQRGWANRLAPLTPAAAPLGQLTASWVERTGLSPKVEIRCGLHDSNAALLAARDHPDIRGRDTTVLSTGTWFVAMRAPLASVRAHRSALTEARDCLVNVDVSGVPIPSARFMGGREIEMLAGAESADTVPSSLESGLANLLPALKSGELILPGLVPGAGPFPKAGRHAANMRRHNEGTAALAHLYAALVADVSLDLIGSRDALLIDGRFAQAPIFVHALAALRPDTTVFVSRDTHGVARGALRLVHGPDSDAPRLERVSPMPVDLSVYRARWRDAVEQFA
jgi:sugar (pentulose or hexulose) kinase